MSLMIGPAARILHRRVGARSEPLISGVYRSSISGIHHMPDPHSISDTLDQATTSNIITRLEKRGRDALFRQTFMPHFSRLHSVKTILDLGCGTGVVSRALVADPLFAGKITAVDQSADFLRHAQHFSQEEGNDPGRLQFMQVDGHNLSTQLCADQFDAVLMHTLISHVHEPLAVLKAARDVARQGALLIITDGDYGSLTYAHDCDPDMGRQIDAALKDSVFAQPNIMRQLPALLKNATGWELEEISTHCISEVGASPSYWVSFAECYLPRLKESGLIEAHTVDRWWDSQQLAIAEGTFFAHCVYYTYFCRAV